jgi:hypothetical protein
VRYSRTHLDKLRERCRSAHGSAARGATLEDLADYVFSKVPSVVLHERDVKDEDGSHELDLVYGHFVTLSRMPIPDVALIVECKNESARTSSAHVHAFGTKLRTRSLTAGVLVTTAGLSGRRGRHGHAAIRDQLTMGAAIIVVTADELAALRTTQDLTGLLTHRMLELQTNRGYVSL